MWTFLYGGRPTSFLHQTVLIAQSTQNKTINAEHKAFARGAQQDLCTETKTLVAMDATPRTRTPRMVRTIKPGEGVADSESLFVAR